LELVNYMKLSVAWRQADDAFGNSSDEMTSRESSQRLEAIAEEPVAQTCARCQISPPRRAKWRNNPPLRSGIRHICAQQRVGLRSEQNITLPGKNS
jgi:hypothetical protein